MARRVNSENLPGISSNWIKIHIYTYPWTPRLLLNLTSKPFLNQLCTHFSTAPGFLYTTVFSSHQISVLLTPKSSMSHHRSSSSDLKTASNHFEKRPHMIKYQAALRAALRKYPAETRLATYLELQTKVGKECDWLNDEIGYELSNNGKHEEALAYWKGRFLKQPGLLVIHRGLEFALEGFPPTRRLKEVEDLENKVKVDHGADWIKKHYSEIKIAMGDYEDSLKILYEDWKSDRSVFRMKELTNGLEDAVEKQPDIVMDYLERLARHGCFDVDLFMHIQAKPDYKGDSTSYLKKCTKQTKEDSGIERCYAYIYLAYMNGEHKHKHKADRNERANRSHSADRNHSAVYIQQAVVQSGSLSNDRAMKVLGKLLEYEFLGQAEELCLQRIKKDPSSIFVEEFIKLKKPRDELEKASLLYDSNPDALRFATKLLDATNRCKTHAIAAEICKKILLNSRHNDQIRTLATESLATKLEHVKIQSAIDTWRDLIMKYPKDERFRSHLTGLLSSRGTLDQTITVWNGLANHLNDAGCHKSYEEAKQRKSDQAKQKKYEAKQKRDQAKLQKELKKKFGDEWDTICPTCMVNNLDTLLVSCGHVCCGECAEKLESKCHMCRSKFTSAIKVHARLLWVND
jgi:hypothetical protein